MTGRRERAVSLPDRSSDATFILIPVIRSDPGFPSLNSETSVPHFGRRSSHESGETPTGRTR